MNNHMHPHQMKPPINSLARDRSVSVSRRVALKTGLGLVVLSTGIGTYFGLEKAFTQAAPSSTNVVIQWNNAVLQAIRNVNPGPTIAARALAITHTCIYDAWAPYDANAVPTQSTGIAKRSFAASSAITNSVSYAAYQALMDLFPTQATPFNSLMTSLGYDPGNTSTDTSTPTGIGNVAARAVISYRHTDGSNQLGNLNQGAPYSDYTGYTPVNTPTSVNDPNRWQPLYIPSTGVTQKAVFFLARTATSC